MKKIEEKRDYNKTHPELREGEMFLTNSLYEDYTWIRWNTKRMGMQAYDIEGERIREYRPVFVQRKEYEEGMKKI